MFECMPIFEWQKRCLSFMLSSRATYWTLKSPSSCIVLFLFRWENYGFQLWNSIHSPIHFTVYASSNLNLKEDWMRRKAVVKKKKNMLPNTKQEQELKSRQWLSWYRCSFFIIPLTSLFYNLFWTSRVWFVSQTARFFNKITSLSFLD